MRLADAILEALARGHRVEFRQYGDTIGEPAAVECVLYELRWRYTADGAIYATYCLPNATDAEFDEPELSQAQVEAFAVQLRGAIFSRLARGPVRPLDVAMCRQLTRERRE